MIAGNTYHRERKFRVAIVSATGTGAKRTIPALADSSFIEVVAIHGRDYKKLKQISDKFKIGSIYTDLSKMVDECIFDFAVVCSPPFLHLEQATQLISAKIPILLEKPAALSAKDVKRLIVLSQNNKTEVRIAHHLRFSPILQIVRNLISDGKLGKLLSASMEWSFKLNRSSQNALWKLNPALNGPTCISDAGVHCFDIAVSLFGQGTLLNLAIQDTGNDKTVEKLVLTSVHGDVLVTTACSRLYGPYSNRLCITGTKGEILIPEFFSEQPAVNGVLYIGNKKEIINSVAENLYQIEVEDFANILIGTESNQATTLEEAFKTALLIDDVANKLPHV